jgi:tetratricopeptide (TPR) repeat protein
MTERFARHKHILDRLIAWLARRGTILSLVILSAAIAATAQNGNDYIHFRLGTKYRTENKLDLAIEEFRKVLAASPDNFNAYFQLAEIREQQGKVRLAIYNLDQALTHNPGWGKAQKMLARLYEKDRRYNKALEQLQDYQRHCDPAERDSISQEIDRIMAMLYGAKKIDASKKNDRQSVSSESASSRGKNPAPGKRSAPSSSSASRTKADQEFRKGIALYQQGVNEHDEKKFGQALNHLRAAIRLQPGHPGAYYYAGLIRRRQGRNDMAKVNFERSLGYPELGYNAHFYLGRIYGDEKAYKKAITHLQAYIGKTDYEPGKREAESLIQRYRRTLQAERKKSPRVDAAELVREEMHREVSRIPPQEKISALEVRIDSLLYMEVVDTLTDPGQAMLRGVRLFRKGEYDEAIESFRTVMVEYPRADVAARCVYDIGVSYLKLGDFAGAENQFQQILERFAGQSVAPQSLFLKALSYAERREPQVAEKLFRSFISQNRTHEWTGKAYEKLGDCYRDLEEHKRSIDAYSQASERAADALDKVHAEYKLGMSYQAVKNQRRAAAAFRRVIEAAESKNIQERVAQAHYRIADMRFKKKDYDKALEMYVRATRKYPAYEDTPWGLFQIGTIYKQLGKYEKAIETYKTLMKQYGGDYWARQAEWKLEDAVWENEYRAVLK